jgi:hypothetical protein
MRKILIGILVIGLFFGGTLWALEALWPGNPMADKRPALAELPPLKPATQASSIVAPVAVALNAIRDNLDAAVPRDLTGKRENPLAEVFGKTDIGWTISRGPLSVSGHTEGVNIVAPLNGSLRVTGQIANAAGGLTGALAGIMGPDLGRGIQNLTTRVLDQRADIRGNMTVLARPTLQPNWRIEPNLTGQVTIAESGLTIAGIKLNAGSEVKPLLDQTLNEQMAVLQNVLRNDPRLEQTARREWAKMCRSIQIGGLDANAPKLWLELKPTHAFAAQPRIVPDWAILTIGVQAETRIVANETKPNCPFPSRLEIVPPIAQGKVAIAVPIDVPLAELSRILDGQLKNKVFPNAGSGSSAEITVLQAQLAASGDRLLISLRVKARETKSWFGFGGEATVHIWGRPSLDRAQQILRLADIALDVESEAAFGLMGAAARAAIPYVQAEIADKAVFDFKPFAASARQSIEAALAGFQNQRDGVRAETALTGLRLAGIEFDSNTLRVVAEAEGTARALVTALPR